MYHLTTTEKEGKTENDRLTSPAPLGELTLIFNICLSSHKGLLFEVNQSVSYFFGYKTGFFPSKTIQKFSIRLVRRI